MSNDFWDIELELKRRMPTMKEYMSHKKVLFKFKKMIEIYKNQQENEFKLAPVPSLKPTAV